MYIYGIHFHVFIDKNELSDTSQPLPVSGGGGHGGGAVSLPYSVLLAKDHPQGEQSITIKDDSNDLSQFKEALDLMKDEKQVLILLDTFFSKNASDVISAHLPENSYTEHYDYKHDNDSAAAWVEHHMNCQENDAIDQNFKFLIGDWCTTAGYEVPALIFVTNDLDYYNIPTHIQRAKAKLVIYHATNLKDVCDISDSDEELDF